VAVWRGDRGGGGEGGNSPFETALFPYGEGGENGLYAVGSQMVSRDQRKELGEEQERFCHCPCQKGHFAFYGGIATLSVTGGWEIPGRERTVYMHICGGKSQLLLVLLFSQRRENMGRYTSTASQKERGGSPKGR